MKCPNNDCKREMSYAFSTADKQVYRCPCCGCEVVKHKGSHQALPGVYMTKQGLQHLTKIHHGG